MNTLLNDTPKYIKWLKRKLDLNMVADRARSRKVVRNKVYWCDFGLNVGSEMSKESARPCVIIQKKSI